MTEEQEKAIEKLNSYKSHIENRGNIKSKHYKAVKIALNLIQKQQEELDSLKEIKEIAESKVTDLRKIKQVESLELENWELRKELEKYKIESNNFWEEWNNLELSCFEEKQRLRAKLEKKDKIINEIAKDKYKNISMLEMAKIGQAIEYDPTIMFNGISDEEAINIIKQYFEKKVEGKQ